MSDKPKSSKPQRRQFLQSAGAATLSGLDANYPPEICAAKPISKTTADSVILLWMGGGMASTETFDPKYLAPFEKGMDPKRILCTFPAIDTVCDHIKVSQGLEQVASVMDKATLIRSYTAPDLGHTSHSRYQYHWLTGHPPSSSSTALHIGSVIAKTLGCKNPVVPAFIDIGESPTFREEQYFAASHIAKVLGSECTPFWVPFPRRRPKPFSNVTLARLKNFHQRNQVIPASNFPHTFDSQSDNNGLCGRGDASKPTMPPPVTKAFDLSLESEQTRNRYGNSRFGRGCLLARRLIEAGGRFIKVTTGTTPFSDWDTHENGHRRMSQLKKKIDSPIAQLVLDLEDRGLLTRTIIVVASEFSRAVKTNQPTEKRSKFESFTSNKISSLNDYGLHTHFTGAGSILIFGGGFKRGHLHGATADDAPCTTTQAPVTIENLHATIYKTLGISPRLRFEANDRSFFITRNGSGKPIDSLLL